MNKEIKDTWITALRSGMYQRTEGNLRRGENEYCCLGVLCDLYSPDSWQRRATDTSWDELVYTYVFVVGESKQDEMPQTEVLTWANLEYSDARALADMNDSGKDFATIAQWIEDNL